MFVRLRYIFAWESSIFLMQNGYLPSAWISTSLVCFLSQRATTCRASVSGVFWAACGFCGQTMVPVCSIVLLCEAAACAEFCKGDWREEASTSRADLCCQQNSEGLIWLFRGWEARARMLVLQKEKCRLKAQTPKPAPARGRGIKGSSCCSEKCWFLEEPVLWAQPLPRQRWEEAVFPTSLAQVKEAVEPCLLAACWNLSCATAWFCSYSWVEYSERCVDRLSVHFLNYCFMNPKRTVLGNFHFQKACLSLS